MKKKIGDLTINEINKLCKTTSCEKCPFKQVLLKAQDQEKETRKGKKI